MSVHSEKVNFRIDPKLKASVEKVFAALGLSTGEACRMFFTQVAIQNGLPFEVRVPNTETLEALQKMEQGKGERFATVNDLFASWEQDA